MKLKDASILHKALLSVALILLPVIITFAVTYVKSNRYLKAFAVDDLTVMAEAFEGQVYQFLEMSRRRARDFASDRNIREMAQRLAAGDGPAGVRLARYLAENKLPLDARISRICLVSPDGVIMTSTDSSHVGADVSGELFFRRAGMGVDVAETPGAQGRPEIAVTSQVMDPLTGEPAALLVNFIHIAGLGDVLSGHFNRELGAISRSKGKRETMEVYLVNRDRLMLTESKFVKDAPLRQVVDTLPVRECLESGREVSAFYTGYLGADVAGASMCLPLMDWTLMVEVISSEIFAPLYEMRRNAFVGAVVVAGLIGALFAVFYRMVVARLRLLSGASSSVAGGDYDISLPVDSGDEIGVLSGSFNSMAREIKHRAQLLGLSEQKYRSLVSNIPDVIWTGDAGGSKVFVGANAADVLGYSAMEIISTPGLWKESMHKDDGQRVLAAYGALFRDGRGFDEEYRVRRKDGQWIWVCDRAAGVYEKDGARYTDGVLSDITERKAAQERVMRLNRLYSVLSGINEAIVRIRDIPALYAAACRIAVEDGNFSLAWAGVLDETTGRVRQAACYGHEGFCADGLSEDVPQGVGPVVSNDIETDTRAFAWRARALEMGLRSVAAIPLLKDAKPSGFVNLYSKEPDFFNDEETKLLVSMAADISFAVETIENERLARKADEELHLLHDLSISIRDATDFRSALDVVITGLCKATGWSLGEAWMPSKSGGELEYVLSCGCKGVDEFHGFVEASRKITFKRGEGVPGRVWADKKPLWIKDITSRGNGFMRVELAREAGFRAQFGIPIIEGPDVLAVVVFLMAQKREEDERQLYFVTTVCAQLAAVLRRKLVKEERLEIRRRYEELVNNLTVGVYRDMQGAQGHIVEANSAIVEMLEAPSREALVGRRMRDFYFEDKKREELDAKMLEQDFIKNEEIELVTYSGRRLWASVTAVMKKDGSGQRYFDGIMEDITEKKKLEDQLRHAQKMEAVGQLAGGIAHDFNNILTALIGYGNLLVRKRGADKLVREYADHMLELSDKGVNLTQGLLAFSRKQEISTEPVDLKALLKRFKKILQRLIGTDIGINLSHARRDVIIRGDATQIEHVLMNLATNARDAMPEGGAINIKTEVAELDPEFIESHGYGSPGAYARVTFADTGSGMGPETLKRIFEPFFTTKEVGRGTGLGLSMAYGIIKQHNGFIEAKSEPGKGTAFLIYLPIAGAGNGAAGRKERVVAGRGETILLAEDEEDVRRSTASILEEFGYKVIAAADGEKAASLFRKNRKSIGLVLLDVIMPKKNGKEVLAEIREMEPGVRVLFTSYAADVMDVMGIEISGEAFVSKPVSPSGLLLKVREVLDK